MINLELKNKILKDKNSEREDLIESQKKLLHVKQNNLDHSELLNKQLKNDLTVVKQELESNTLLVEKLEEEKKLESENRIAHEALLMSTINKSNKSDSLASCLCDSNTTVTPLFESFERLYHRKTIQSHTRNIWALSYFKKLDIKCLSTGSYHDKNIKIWDLSDFENATVSATLSTSANVISITTFKNDGSQFLASGVCYSFKFLFFNFPAIFPTFFFLFKRVVIVM